MTLSRTATVLFAVATATVTASAKSAGAQQPADTGTFALVQNGTTIATETFERSAERFKTELAIVNQATLVTRADLRPDATIARLEVEVFPPGPTTGAPIQSSAVTFAEGRASAEQPIGTPAPGSATAVDPGAVPYVNPSPTFMEQILRRARAIGGDSVSVPIWVPGPSGGSVTAATVTFRDGDATLELGGVLIEAATDADGRLLSAEVPAQGLVIERS